MIYSIRMLGSIQKWTYSSRNKYVRADPLGDLKTQENKLSLYRVNNEDPKKIDNTLIAVLASEKPSGLDKFDYVVLSLQEIRSLGLTIIHSPDGARTTIKKIKDRHYDITKLYAHDLITFAKLILKKVNRVKAKNTIKRDKVKEFIFEALNNKTIKVQDLNSKIKRDLQICDIKDKQVSD